MDNKDKYIGRVFDDRYVVQELIGEGGMAVVYKGQDLRLDRSVAIKIMRDEMAADEEFRRAFCAEAHAVAMLSNPNIVAVYDVSHSEDIEYIVMELVDHAAAVYGQARRAAVARGAALYATDRPRPRPRP